MVMDIIMVTVEGSKKMENNQENNDLIDLNELLAKVFRIIEKYLILLICIIVGCIVIFPLKSKLVYQPLYSSQITFVVTKEIDGDTTFQYNADSVDKIAETFQYIINSQPLKDKMNIDLGTNQLPAALSLSKVHSTNLFTVKATSSSPELAYKTIIAFNNNYASFSRILLDNATLTLIEDAEIPVIPDNPLDLSNDAVKGLIVGFVVDVGIVTLLYIFKKTIYQRDDVKKYLNCHCVGIIPKVKMTRENKHTPVLLTNYLNNYNFKESLYNLRYELESDSKNNHNKVYMVTSCVPSEGKSTVIANMAIALAANNYKVALVDLDLRNPTLAKLFETKNEKGVLECLKTGSLAKDMLTKQYENLTLLAGSEICDTPTELLSQEYLKILIDNLKKDYDYVLIDTPPIHIMDDAIIISEYVDSSILVVKQDYLSVDKIYEALDQLAVVNQHILGCIINQSNLGGITKRYGYGYGYGYGKSK